MKIIKTLLFYLSITATLYGNILPQLDMTSATHRSNDIPLLLEEAIKIGLSNNNNLRASAWEIKAKKAMLAAVKTEWSPSVKLHANYTRLSKISPSELTVPIVGSVTISQNPSNYWDFGASVQQPVFTGLRLHSDIDIAEQAANISTKEYIVNKRDLICGIKKVYWEFFKTIEFLRVANDNVNRIKSHLNDVENFFCQGMVTNDEVLRIQTKLANGELVQIEAQNNVENMRTAFNNLIGLPLDSPTVPITSPSGITIEEPKLIPLQQKALDHRQEITVAEHHKQINRDQMTLAKSSRFPQVFLFGNYNYDKPNKRIFPVQDRFKSTWNVGVSISYEIWHGNRSSHELRAATSRLKKTEHMLAQLKDDIKLEVTQGFLGIVRAESAIPAAREALISAQESYKLTKNRYEEGLARNTDLLDAEVSLLQAQTNLTQATANYAIAIAELQRSIGEAN